MPAVSTDEAELFLLAFRFSLWLRVSTMTAVCCSRWREKGEKNRWPTYCVARSSRVHCHLALPVLMWKVRPFFSMAARRAASVLEDMLKDGCVWMFGRVYVGIFVCASLARAL